MWDASIGLAVTSTVLVAVGLPLAVVGDDHVHALKRQRAQLGFSTAFGARSGRASLSLTF